MLFSLHLSFFFSVVVVVMSQGLIWCIRFVFMFISMLYLVYVRIAVHLIGHGIENRSKFTNILIFK